MAKVFESSKHPDDHRYFFHDITARLLYTITPDRLERSIKTLPRASSWQSLERILNKAYDRWVFLRHQEKHDLKEQESDEPPSVKVLVMGGSVAIGAQCRYVGGGGPSIPRRRCAWPFRTVALLNTLLGADVFELLDAAAGGSNTETALSLLEYDLVPIESADVVIHAYSTNDMHLYTIQGAEQNNQTLRERVLDLTEQFVRKTMLPRPCQTEGEAPLLIHFDDYIGNQQRKIIDTTALTQSVQTLANYYGFMSVSYADVVRDIVYGDTTESWFSPEKWYSKGNPKMKLEIHPTMGMHLTSSWIFAYNMMNLVSQFCSVSRHVTKDAKANSIRDAENEIKYEAGDGLPKLKGQSYTLKTPKRLPQGLPPALSQGASLDDVSKVWRRTSKELLLRNVSCGNQTSHSTKRCIHSWISHISFHTEVELNETISPYLVDNLGWKTELQFKKLGLVAARGLHSRFSMEFKNLTQPIRSITWMIMKSYGPKWLESLVKVSAFHRQRDANDWLEVVMDNAEMQGHHEKNTSETYSHTISLGPNQTLINIGEDLRITVKVKKGNTFKIMGMAVCS